MAIPEYSDPFCQTHIPPSSLSSVANESRQHSAPSKRARAHTRSIAAMVPLADFCNHSYTRSLSHFEVLGGGQEGSDCVSLVCDCDVKSGQEVLICYGAKTTAQLLCFYGFEMGAPLPCDLLHVALVMPLLPISNVAEALSLVKCADDVCIEYLTKCSLCISDDNTISCSLVSPFTSSDSLPSNPSCAPSSSSTTPSSAVPDPCIHHHHIVHGQLSVSILTAVANGIRCILGSSSAPDSAVSFDCEPLGQGGVSFETNCDDSSAACPSADGSDWLQVIFDAYTRSSVSVILLR